MSKLDEAITRYNADRDKVISLNASLREAHADLLRAEAAVRAATETVQQTEEALRRAKASLAATADKISPLVHADVAGICGRLVPNPPVADNAS